MDTFTFPFIDEQLSSDVVSVCDSVKSVSSVVTPDMQRYLEDGLYHGHCPQQMALTLANNIMDDRWENDGVDRAGGYIGYRDSIKVS